MQEIIIKENEAGQRMDKLLKKYLKEAPGSFIYKMLRKKNITLNGKKALGKEILVTGDRILLFFSGDTLDRFTGEKGSGSSAVSSKEAEYRRAFLALKEMEIVFENEHILLLNKPAGILSQKSLPKDISVNEWFIGYLLSKGQISGQQLKTFKPSICNRLDRNTSGLIICSKTLAASRQMNLLIKERKIRKYYRTFVHGLLTAELYLKGYMKKDEASNKVQVYDRPMPKASYMETRVIPLFSYPGHTYTEVELITGKTHQIRAHLASIGHPLLGDVKYGGRSLNDEKKPVPLPKGQLLHSYRIVFPRLTGEWKELSEREFTAREPDYFDTLKTGYQ